MELKQGLNLNTLATSGTETYENPKTSPLKTPVHSSTSKTNLVSINSATKEVGEIEDSSNSRETSLVVTVCSQCQGNLRVELQDSNDYELQSKYHDVLQENDILRQGMLEILEKLREYDGKEA